MDLKTFIFIGRSGCGKGTQVELLKKHLEKIDPNTSIFSLGTGSFFREFFAGDSDTAKRAKKINDIGALQPEFLTVHLWSDYLVENFREGQHMIMDGTPRKVHEATVLDSAFKFYDRKKPNILYVDVGRSWAKEKLLGRGRGDDTEEDINRRLDWFETDVLPTIDYYKKNNQYEFVEINGEQTVEKVHREILRKTGL